MYVSATNIIRQLGCCKAGIVATIPHLACGKYTNKKRGIKYLGSLSEKDVIAIISFMVNQIFCLLNNWLISLPVDYLTQVMFSVN